MTQIIEIKPQDFTNELDDYIKQNLKQEIFSSSIARYGYIVTIHNISSISDGILRTSTGTAVFTVKFTAIIYRPYKNEVVDGTVCAVNKV